MQHIIYTVFSIATFFVGTGFMFQLTATPLRNVDYMVIAKDQTAVDVYSPRGICTFELTSTVETPVTITMHYEGARLFRKIEGLTINGENAEDAIAGPNQIRITLSANERVRIQVIDFYR